MASSSCKATMTIGHISGLNLIAGKLGIDGEIRLRIGGLNGRQDVWIILDLFRVSKEWLCYVQSI